MRNPRPIILFSNFGNCALRLSRFHSDRCSGVMLFRSCHARSTSTSVRSDDYNTPVVESHAPAPARTCGCKLSGSSCTSRLDCASSSGAVHRQPLRFLCPSLVKAPKLPRVWGLLLLMPQSLWKWQRWGHLSLPNLAQRCVWWHLVVEALSEMVQLVPEIAEPCTFLFLEPGVVMELGGRACRVVGGFSKSACSANVERHSVVLKPIAASQNIFGFAETLHLNSVARRNDHELRFCSFFLQMQC